MAGRKPIPINLINLKATAPSGDVMTFESIPEAAREMGLVSVELGKRIMQRETQLENTSWNG